MPAVAGVLGLAAAALVVAYLLLGSCGVRGLLEACPQALDAVSAGLERESARTRVLQDRIERLEREIAGLPDCPPSRPAAPLAGELTHDSGDVAQTPPEDGEAPPPPEDPAETAPPLEETPEETGAPDEGSPEQSEFDERLEAENGEVSETLTVTLIWDDRSDLDLQVHCPGGGTAGVRGTGCGGGVLDVDANGYGSGVLHIMENPVENVRFGPQAPPGEYRIRVFIGESYENNIGIDRTRNTGSHPFRVRVISNGESHVFTGTHRGLGRDDVWFSFTH